MKRPKQKYKVYYKKDKDNRCYSKPDLEQDYRYCSEFSAFSKHHLVQELALYANEIPGVYKLDIGDIIFDKTENKYYVLTEIGSWAQVFPL